MKKIPKILVVGSYMMDLVASTRRAPKEGETVIGMKFNMAPGGKGNNQAVQCARLGAQVTMVGQVGKDAFGQKLLDGAARAGVDISHVLVTRRRPPASPTSPWRCQSTTPATASPYAPGPTLL